MAARDSLAEELKASDRPEEAAEVKKLRRPSVVAWGVNVMSRERPEEVVGLLKAGEALRRAQRKALSSRGRDELRRATDERRALIETLASATVKVMGIRAGAHRDAIAATLEAASVDEELGEQLSTGSLEREARPTAGFGPVEGFEVLLGGGADEELAESPGRLEEDPREIAREARAAAQGAAAAERAAEKSRRRADELKKRAAAAVSAAREAEGEAKRLADEAKTERRRADRASRAAETARGGS